MKEPTVAGSSETIRRFALAILSVVFAVASYFLYDGIVSEDWGQGIASAVVGVVSGGAASALIPRLLAGRRLGPVRIDFKPSEARPGDEVSVGVFFAPRAVAKLGGLKVRLLGVEEVVSGSGTSRSTHTHQIVALDGSAQLIPRSIRAGEPFHGQARVRVPETAPPTFHAEDNHLIWKVECTIELDDWPDWKDSHELKVRPD